MRELWEELAERVFESVPEEVALPPSVCLPAGRLSVRERIPATLPPDSNPIDRVLRALALENSSAEERRSGELRRGKYNHFLTWSFGYIAVFTLREDEKSSELLRLDLSFDYRNETHASREFFLEFFELGLCYILVDHEDLEPDDEEEEEGCSLLMYRFPGNGSLVRKVSAFDEKTFQALSRLLGRRLIERSMEARGFGFKGRAL